MRHLALLLLVACGRQTPDPCEGMCLVATSAYASCLVEWGVDWEASGHEDADDFQDSCETWAVEMRILAPGAEERDQVDATCATRANTLDVEDGACAAWSEIDWEAPPWE